MWTIAEREIFRFTVDGVELKRDPIRCVLAYNKAVKEAGGPLEYQRRWKRYHREPLPKLLGDATEGQKEDRLTLINDMEVQDAEDCIFLAEIGSKTVGMPLFDPSTHEDGKPQLTIKQARDVVYAYVAFMSKKESGEEISTLPSKPDSPPSDATGEAGPGTPISSPALSPGT